MHTIRVNKMNLATQTLKAKRKILFDKCSLSYFLE